MSLCKDPYHPKDGEGHICLTCGQTGSVERVDHPLHYNQHPSGIECITIVEHMTFNLGNAVKYIWRADHKGETPIEDLRKARWYLEREIAKLEKKR